MKIKEGFQKHQGHDKLELIPIEWNSRNCAEAGLISSTKVRFKLLN